MHPVASAFLLATRYSPNPSRTFEQNSSIPVQSLLRCEREDVHVFSLQHPFQEQLADLVTRSNWFMAGNNLIL